MNPVQKILEYFRVKKTIRYHGTIENLESILGAMEAKRLEKEKFYLNKTDRFRYKLSPTISLGTMDISSSGTEVFRDQISVQIELNSKKVDLQEIQLKGKRHYGHIFIFLAFLFLLSILTITTAKETLVPLILGLPLWVIFHRWFNFVWTSQEKALIDEIKLALHVRIKVGIYL